MIIRRTIEYSFSYSSDVGTYNGTVKVFDVPSYRSLLLTVNNVRRDLPLTVDKIPSLKGLEDMVAAQVYLRSGRKAPQELPPLSSLLDRSPDPAETELYSIIESILQLHSQTR